jgi:hypothetical protein
LNEKYQDLRVNFESQREENVKLLSTIARLTAKLKLDD